MPPDPNLPPIEIDPKFAKAVDPSSPPPIRLMAARGVVPGAKAADILLIQYALTFDAAEDVAATAKKLLIETPSNVLKGSIDAKTHPGILDLLARERSTDEVILEFLVLRKQIPDDTLIFLAETCTILNTVEIIAKNQERLLQNIKILDALKKNPVTPKSVIDVTVAFLQMAGVLPTGAEARAEGLPEKVETALMNRLLDEEEFDEAMTADRADGKGISEDETRTLLQKLQDMNIAKKVKLAYRANKEVRAILIRDTNRILVTAVLRSERVTEAEAREFSRNRTISSDVLRWIANKRDFVKNYEVRKNLCFNPKTPQDVSIKQIEFMRPADLLSLSRDNGVPMSIRSKAGNLSKMKSSHR